MFADNAQNVQRYVPGQVVNMTVALPIPHEGPANVSIVQTSTNTIVGDMLLFFASYADESLAELPANNTAFAVTMPTGAAGAAAAAACARPGDCVLQWWWFGTGAQQTYESCVDFVLGPEAQVQDAPPVEGSFGGVQGLIPIANAGVAVELSVPSTVRRSRVYREYY